MTYDFTTIVVLSLFSICLGQQPKSTDDSIPTISYCELVRNASTYEGRVVRVKATWQWGFEWSFLYDRNCMEREKRAWVEFVDDEDRCAATKKNDRKLGNNKDFNNKADVAVVGKLSYGGNYGHMNGYRYQFVVSCLEDAHRIPASMP